MDRFLVSGHIGGVYATTNYLDHKDWGWQAGGGLDYALTGNLIVGAQYAHYDFSKFDGTSVDATADNLAARFSYQF